MMTGNAACLVRFATGLSGLVVLGWFLAGHAAQPAQEGLPMDWSHHHVIFSQPATAEQAARVARDPRYWQQWARQNIARVLSSDSGNQAFGVPSFPGITQEKVQADWSEDLGSYTTATGAGIFPAKYAFQITSASCANDYVVFSTGLTGASNQASIVAYSNLYSGCSGAVPQVYWAYNTGGPITTSPAISGDGTQVAFAQTTPGAGGGHGSLVLLKFAPSTTESVTSPMSLTSVAASSYRTCTAPCMTEVPLVDNLGVQLDDRTSSVFPDYLHDIIWVGGIDSWLHKITGVFRGNPAEVTTGGFPVQLNPSNPNPLSSPVYDHTSGNVFVGDYGGFLYRVSSAGVVTASSQVDHGTGLVAAPIVDSTSGKVYVFSSDDGGSSCPGFVPCAAVLQFTTSFAGGNQGLKVTVGSSQVAPPNPNPLYEGSFDSTYRASANVTGNLYVCGNTAGSPTLYQIPITAGVMAAAVTGPTLTSATTGCSPVTDISNPNAAGGTAEWIFASAQASGSGNNCAGGGCIMNFNVQPWKPSTAYTVGQKVIDTNFHVQVVRVAGTSRTAAQGHPAWTAATDGSTTDNTVRWTNQGPHLAAHATWLPSHAYTAGTVIVDSNNNVEWVLTAGTSRTVAQGHPGWSLLINGTTADNTVRWRNLGPIATASAAASGGTSGIIMDNTVPSGTLPGASQVYYSTQGPQTCTTSGGTGGCAVQASQSGLN
jgi:hypothetical protein